jgi:tetratricopeptide (TPR) repeat protein
MTDVYGNAQFDLPDRRPLSLFDLEAGADTLGAYQALNRPTDQRGGPFAFALPGELLGLQTMQTLVDSASPSVFADVTAARQRAMLQYGGFGVRSAPAMEDSISSAFARRQRLINATSLYTPVYRAMLENTSLSGLRQATPASPVSLRGMNAPNRPETADSASSLYELLKTDRQATYEDSREEGWTRFAEGEYRQAARAFEATLDLNPDDGDARTGEIFSYAAIGARATTATLVQQFSRRAANPFMHDQPLRERFSDAQLVDQLLLHARGQVESAGGSANVNLLAADVFVLWHLGDYQTALRAAEGLAKSRETAAYADWPVKMRAARSALPGDSSR